uniref:Uncharacterized protein n=1 Tax=Ciona savignyi TaxID=51511 RepID=H2YYC6_CIOSA
IKFLRREKEISETKYELVKAEVLRYKQQLHHSDEQIKQIQTDLAAEQSKVQEQLGQLSELATLKREVSNLRMVEENNKKLREERDQLDADLRASNARMTSLQADLAPLQTKNR